MATQNRLAEFGRGVRATREFKNLTLEQVAKLLAKEGVQVTYQAVGAWERGETEPSRDKVYALERALKVKAGELSAPLGYVAPGRPATEADYNSRISRMPARVRQIIEDIIDAEERRRR